MTHFRTAQCWIQRRITGQVAQKIADIPMLSGFGFRCVGDFNERQHFAFDRLRNGCCAESYSTRFCRIGDVLV